MKKTLSYHEVSVGDKLPELLIPLTRTLIVATAIATRDYQDIHHDPDKAHARGLKDIITNVFTTNGFIGRYITDWAGPGTHLKKVAIALGVPNYPGDTMTLFGQITAKQNSLIEISIRGVNSLGDHVTGTVTLELPESNK